MTKELIDLWPIRLLRDVHVFKFRTKRTSRILWSTAVPMEPETIGSFSKKNSIYTTLIRLTNKHY